jgi:hypothetical protein
MRGFEAALLTASAIAFVGAVVAAVLVRTHLEPRRAVEPIAEAG